MRRSLLLLFAVLAGLALALSWATTAVAQEDLIFEVKENPHLVVSSSPTSGGYYPATINVKRLSRPAYVMVLVPRSSGYMVVHRGFYGSCYYSSCPALRFNLPSPSPYTIRVVAVPTLPPALSAGMVPVGFLSSISVYVMRTIVVINRSAPASYGYYQRPGGGADLLVAVTLTAAVLMTYVLLWQLLIRR